jgi:ligand-binding sensor domain-containing protein
MHGTKGGIVSKYYLAFVIMLLSIVPFDASENSHQPTRLGNALARVSFWLPPDRIPEFELIFHKNVVPILSKYNLQVSSYQSQSTVDSSFSVLFDLSNNTNIAEIKKALQRDGRWIKLLGDLAEFGSPKEMEFLPHTLNWYIVPTVGGSTIEPAYRQGTWTTYDFLDGLVAAHVWTIQKDRLGNIWFGTPQGVSRFDGATWKTFNTEDGLADNFVRSILEDRSKNMWFGTDNGVSRFDGHTWITFNADSGLVNNLVYTMVEDNTGNLWFGTQGGVSRFDGKTWTTFNTANGLVNDFVMSSYKDRSGNLWFGTQGGVSRFDGKIWTTFSHEDGLAVNFVVSILEDKSKNMWFGTDHGLSRFDGKIWTTFGREEGIASDYVGSMFEDRRGNLWFATPEGVSRFDGNIWETFSQKDGLANNDVTTILEDQVGNLWFGSWGGGASRYSDRFEFYGGLGHIQMLFEDKKGHLWVATGYEGVSRFDGQTWTTFRQKDGLASNTIHVISEDDSENLWFGTSDGVSRFDGQTWKRFGPEDGLAGSKGNDVRSIIEDRSGNLWFGTSDGVSRFDGQTWKRFDTDDGLASNFVISIMEDRAGNLWFGTPDGVSRYDGKRWTTFNADDGLGGNEVSSIMEDRSGNIWFLCWGAGVARYNGHSWVNYTEEDGLAGDQVVGTLEDRFGNLWFGTTGAGLSVYDGKVFQTVNTRDGISDNVIRSILQSSAGDIYFGTANGITRYRPSLPLAPRVVVDAVVADRRYEKPTAISIPSTTSLVAFEFHGMSLITRPEAIVYRYRLNGYDTQWHSTRARRVEYSDIPIGEYTFEIVAVDQNLNYTDQPSSVPLTIYFKPVNSPVQLSDINIQNIFASFYKTYAERPIGSVVVSNIGAHPIDVNVGFFIPGLMDRPKENQVALGPNTEQRVLLNALFSPDILNHMGDQPIQAEISISFAAGDQVISVKEYSNTKLYGRGFLTWDHLDRAAAFVTPEDAKVTTLARSFYEAYRHQIKGRNVDGNIPAAALMYSVLNEYGIKYAKDSSTPYSQVRIEESAIDNIQYPSELLDSRLGDCDDCTVLYCSLLENLNIPTAFVDAPGHILMMFDSGVTSEHEFGFSLDEDLYIERAGRFWIPIEVTKLGEGSFMEAWELGAKICHRLMLEESLYVTDVGEAWAEYPYALPISENTIEFGNSDRIKQSFQKNIKELHNLREQYVNYAYVQPLIENTGDTLRRINFAKTRIEGEEYNDAIAMLMPLLHTSHRAEAYYLIGYAYVGQKNYQTAIQYFERALGIKPEHTGYAQSLEIIRSLVEAPRE